jgi:hypothetical protein
MKYLAIALCFCAVGCIRAPAAGGLGIAPGTPAPTPQQVSSCETTRTWQNIWTVAASVFSAAAGAQGGADTAFTDKTAQTGIAIGAAASGVIAAVAATAGGIESNTYATDNCQVILTQAASVGVQADAVRTPGF